MGKNNLTGHLAEFLARNFLRLKGYRIIADNYVTGRGTGAGEVDFIAVKGRILIFAEVKKRSSLEKAAYAVSANQQRRLVNASQAFVKKNPCYREYDIRFDAVLVCLPFRLRHLKNAWSS